MLITMTILTQLFIILLFERRTNGVSNRTNIEALLIHSFVHKIVHSSYNIHHQSQISGANIDIHKRNLRYYNRLLFFSFIH